MRLTTMTRGRLISSAYCQTFSVTTSTPETPSTTTNAASATDMATLASCANMVKPGESNRLILVLCHSTEAMAVEMVIWREISSSSWSVTVEPSSTRPSLGVEPPLYNIAETREVLPEWEWPITTRLRMSLPS